MSAAAATAHARHLQLLRATLLRDVDRIWKDMFDPADPAGSLGRINPLVAARTAQAQEQGLADAAVYADRILLEAFASDAIPAVVPADALVGTDRYGRDITTMLAQGEVMYSRRVASGVTPEAALAAERSFQSSVVGSAVHDTARRFLTGLADPTSGWTHPQVDGWARVAHPGACDFCVMLAGRGFAYTSEETAARAADGSRYHDRCRCTVTIGPAGTRDPAAEAAYRQWKDQGARSKWGKGSDRDERTGQRGKGG
jgi:hypothetical protein